MKTLTLLVGLLILGTTMAEASRFRRKADTLTVVSYNIENFFDPADDPNKNDNEFTPDGPYNWTMSRMSIKATRVARVISSINGWNIPDIVGLCEIEGPDAVELLLQKGRLRRYYSAVAFPTPDRRGIATAMLYRKDRVKVLHSQAICTSDSTRNFFTRDILYAKTAVLRDTFHIFVNHWPSKRGGSSRSDALRDTVAYQLRLFTDSLQAVEPDANIIILGDFNDVATSKSITDVLGVSADTLAVADTSGVKPFCNLSGLTDECSYKYRGSWRTIDHIIVSRTMTQRYECRFDVFKPSYLLQDEPSPYTGEKPFRTYLGQKYNDGYSDHLPVIAKIVMKRSNKQTKENR